MGTENYNFARLKGAVFIFFVGVILMFFQSCGEEAGTSKETGKADTSAADTATVEQRINSLTDQMKFSPKNYQLYYDRSLLYYESGNTVQAISDMEKCLEYNVTSAEGYHMMGFYAKVQNRDDEALEYFRKAIQLNSPDPETPFNIGQLLFFRKEYKEAEEWYTRAIRMDSLEPSYIFARAFLYEAQGQTDKAIDGYQTALRVDPHFIKAMAQLHDVFKDKKKDLASAMAFNDRILLEDSLHPVGRYNNGMLFLEKALAQKPKDKDGEMQRRALFNVAINEFSRSLEKDPDFTNALYNRGYCLYTLEKFPPALADFNKVIGLKPFDERPYFLVGSILEYQGDEAGALEMYRQALKLDPGFDEARRAVAELEPKVSENQEK